VHRRGLAGDVEGEAVRRLPGGDRLDERAGRELAVADGADALAEDRGAQRVGDAGRVDPCRAGRSRSVKPITYGQTFAGGASMITLVDDLALGQRGGQGGLEGGQQRGEEEQGGEVADAGAGRVGHLAADQRRRPSRGRRRSAWP
jgi:hypothetical protein